MIITLNEKKYELKFSIGRVKLIEKRIGGSLLSEIVKTNGVLSLETLESCITYGLKKVDTVGYLPMQNAMKLAEEYMEAEGYSKAIADVTNQISEDLPFLFRNA